MKNTQKMVISALLAAFTCIATMIIKFPTPTFGYIHLGDGLVLICGILLGPVGGAFAAGIGSMFADLFNGYVMWAPGTLIIKAGTAFLAGAIYKYGFKKATTSTSRAIRLILAGIVGEAFMVFGYFLFEILLSILGNGSSDITTLHAAVLASLTGVPFNIVQGIVGITIAFVLVPILQKISTVKELSALH